MDCAESKANPQITYFTSVCFNTLSLFLLNQFYKLLSCREVQSFIIQIQFKIVGLKQQFKYCKIVPVFVRYDTSFHFLVILPNSNGQPRTQFAIVQGVHHPEHFTFIETQSIRRFLLIFKMSSDIERIPYIRLNNATIN